MFVVEPGDLLEGSAELSFAVRECCQDPEVLLLLHLQGIEELAGTARGELYMDMKKKLIES